MSSITTVASTGRLVEACAATPWDEDGIISNCFNGTYPPSDYWTVCCDGEIVDVSRNPDDKPYPELTRRTWPVAAI